MRHALNRSRGLRTVWVIVALIALLWPLNTFADSQAQGQEGAQGQGEQASQNQGEGQGTQDPSANARQKRVRQSENPYARRKAPDHLVVMMQVEVEGEVGLVRRARPTPNPEGTCMAFLQAIEQLTPGVVTVPAEKWVAWCKEQPIELVSCLAPELLFAEECERIQKKHRLEIHAQIQPNEQR